MIPGALRGIASRAVNCEPTPNLVTDPKSKAPGNTCPTPRTKDEHTGKRDREALDFAVTVNAIRGDRPILLLILLQFVFACLGAAASPKYIGRTRIK